MEGDGDACFPDIVTDILRAGGLLSNVPACCASDFSIHFLISLQTLFRKDCFVILDTANADNVYA
jgi:hypothetical protein